MAVERIRIRRDAAATWTSENPTLGLGEMGIETDTGRVKVGDGSTAWISLEYAYAKADRVASKSANYTITGVDDDNVINVTTGASDITITLPAGSGMTAGDIIEVHKVDSGAGRVVVSRAGSDTIDGETSYSLPSQYNMISLRWSGSYWAVEKLKAKYDTGWVANSDWTNAELAVTHNLGSTLGELIVKFLMSADGTDANSFEILDSDFDSNTGTASSNGIVLYQTGTNSLKVQTGAQGISLVQDSGTIAFVDTEAWYYRVVVRRLD